MELVYCNNKWSVFLYMLVWTCLLKIAQSCSCYPKHPQQHFCHSDFVIRAIVIDSHVVWPSADHIVRDGAVSLSSDVIHSAQRAYKLQVRQVFKGDDIHRNQVIFLYTPYQELLCAINALEAGTQYLFMGSFDKVSIKHSINLCNFHHKWSEVTDKQYEGLKHGYKNNCDVKIVVCGIEATCQTGQTGTKLNTLELSPSTTEKPESVCEWDPWKGVCEQLEAVCKRHSHTGRVHWDLSPQHSACRANLYPDMIL